MPREDITIVYATAGLRAHVSLERDDPPLQDAPPPAYGGDVDWLELRASHVKSRGAFTRFLDEQSRASTTLSLWCYRDVWLKLLGLLKLRPPLPSTVPWPPRDGHGD